MNDDLSSASQHRQRSDAGPPEPVRKRFKETVQEDGNVLIDLGSDSDHEDHTKRRSPDRRVRCETVEDEELPNRSNLATQKPCTVDQLHMHMHMHDATAANSDAESDTTLR
jgi:hypothetical protein